MQIFKRIQSFICRVLWLGQFMPTPLHAALHLVRIKLSPKADGQGRYKGMLFIFAARDMSAIREVLVDQEYIFLSSLLRDKDSPVVLDVGANIGMFALWALGVNEKSRILSVEASPQTFVTLEKNAGNTREMDLVWDCLNAAAWKSNDLVSFAAEGDSMGHKVLEEGAHKVQGIRLSELVDRHLEKTGASVIDLLKVDIEGAEEAFLENTEETRSALARVDNLVIELHPEYCNTSEVEELIRACFTHIENQTERISTKPLWYCYR